jgi:hypothetical protein
MARNFNTHAAPFLHGGNYFFYFCRAAAARIWTLIYPPRRACDARQPTSPAGTVQIDSIATKFSTWRTDVRVLPRRPDPEICFLI